MPKPPRKALFLDRDGVINEDVGHICRPEQIVFLDGVFELCRAARAADYLTIVITNQSGIGRGYYTEEDFHALMRWMKEKFAEENARLDDVYFCPHHPEHGLGAYKKECPDRKPGPGLILRAAQDYDVDLAASLLIGNQETDMQAGHRAGVGTLLLLTQESFPHYGTVASLRDAIRMLR